MEIRSLQENFQENGISFTQKFRDSEFAIYELSDGIKGVWYELFKIRTVDSDNCKIEIYPTDEDFGRWAWSLSNGWCLKRRLIFSFGFSSDNADSLLKSLNIDTTKPLRNWKFVSLGSQKNCKNS